MPGVYENKVLRSVTEIKMKIALSQFSILSEKYRIFSKMK